MFSQRHDRIIINESIKDAIPNQSLTNELRNGLLSTDPLLGEYILDGVLEDPGVVAQTHVLQHLDRAQQ